MNDMSAVPMDQITRMESTGLAGGELQPAYDAMGARWRATKDRETGLRLLFLAWYATAEPEELTGLVDPGAAIVAAEVFDTLHRDLPDDPELQLVSHHMIAVCPWALAGRTRTWEKRGRACQKAAHRLGITSLPAETFAGRGAYGAYFEELAPRIWT